MIKRSIDIVASLLFLLMLWPLLLFLAVVIRCVLGSPVLFRQTRPGYGGKLFEMVKFRTMTEARDASGELLPDGDRLHPFGLWLRRTSLDELPEFWNVLKGDMSLVGPRPLLPRYLERYSPEQFRRHEVRPGITGWAQIHGRNAQSWEERFELDVWYVDHQSWWLDMSIVAKTVGKVLRRDGVEASGEATMSEFMGNATANEKGEFLG